MKQIIESIFVENNFKLKNLPSIQDFKYIYAISNNVNRVNYYLVLFIDDLLKSTEMNFEYFYEVLKKSEEYAPAMEKNISLIICSKSHKSGENKGISNLIYDIEENPFYFKKYVLTYTAKQVQNFKEKKQSMNLTMDLLHDILYNHESFRQFKLDPYAETVYNLVSKIFIKLPFLIIENKDIKLADLSENISLALDFKQIKLKNRSLELFDVLNENQDNVRETILQFVEGDKNE